MKVGAEKRWMGERTDGCKSRVNKQSAFQLCNTYAVLLIKAIYHGGKGHLVLKAPALAAFSSRALHLPLLSTFD